MAILPAQCKWWRYPVAAPAAPDLDYRGKKKPIYPVRQFTKKECRAHRLEEWRGQYTNHKKTGERLYPELKHTESRKMEPYRRRLDPALRYLSPRQKDHADDVWQVWCWQTSNCATKHITKIDVRGIKQTKSALEPLAPRYWWEKAKDPITPTHYATYQKFVAAIDARNLFGIRHVTAKPTDDWPGCWCGPGDQVWLPSPRLIGYGERASIVTRKKYAYERPLIASHKPKHKQPAMPNTLWGEPQKLVPIPAWTPALAARIAPAAIGEIAILGAWVFSGTDLGWLFTSRAKTKGHEPSPGSRMAGNVART